MLPGFDVYAQIVNVQPLIVTSDEKEGLAVTLEGSSDVRRGNTHYGTVSGSAIARYRTGPHLFFIMGRGDYAQRLGQPYLDRDLEHARYRLRLVGPWEGELFIQHDRDSFRRLALRTLGGLGPRLHVVRDYGLEVALGTSAMLEFERLGTGDYVDSGQESLVLRSSSYFVFSSRVIEHVTLGNAFYLQPRFDRPEDLRILAETSALVQASKLLSFKMALTSSFDTRPPQAVTPLDITWKTTLAVNF